MDNKTLRIIMLAFVLVFASGCAGTKMVTQEKVSYVPIECGVVPKWDALVLEDVSPQSIKNAALEPGVHFTPEEYKFMAKNWQGVKKFARQTNIVIEFYIECIDTFNKKVERQNEKPPIQSGKSSPAWKFWN